MWFVFPQIKGLGYSTIAKKFAITSLEEARAYLDHLVLGSRLRECTQLVYQIEGRSIEQIFGYPDYLKLASSSFILIKNQRIGDYRFLCLDWREEWTLTFYV